MSGRTYCAQKFLCFLEDFVKRKEKSVERKHLRQPRSKQIKHAKRVSSQCSKTTDVSYSPIRQPCHVARSGDGEGFSHDPSDVVVDDGARFPTVIAPPNVKAEDAPPPYSRIPVVNTTRHNSLSGLRRSRPEEPPRSNSVSVGSPPPYRA
ncbi:DgyrCDS2376 [Dimorphilus gyrociliatus]|uniref:DgyrCDS2376 n=1 Tax=Dimorphilus gyrociliatus TaxID=2664684 RepID=A0A7I8VA37_9ANNE|nr:DgyrCDS2376 [Dimorphilus gyrociliatus]